MSRPRFLADHDLNEHIIDGLLRREPACEFLHARDVGMSDASDPEVLAYAAQNGYIVVSHDVNTMPGHAFALLDAGKAMHGILMVQQTKPIEPVIASLVLIWSASEAEDYYEHRERIDEAIDAPDPFHVGLRLERRAQTLVGAGVFALSSAG